MLQLDAMWVEKCGRRTRRLYACLLFASGMVSRV